MINRKVLSRSQSMLLVLTFLFSLRGVQSFAADETDPVQVWAITGDQSETYDNVTIDELEVEGEGQLAIRYPAVEVHAEGGQSAEIEVNGQFLKKMHGQVIFSGKTLAYIKKKQYFCTKFSYS